MDLDKLAQRAAKRKNNKIQKKYPLFANVFSTTPEEEKKRILRQREQAENHIEEMRKNSLKAWKRGEELKKIAQETLDLSVFQERENFWNRVYKNRVPEYDGADLADFWWSALKGTPYAFEHCPNKQRHTDPRWWGPQWNYLLETFVETEVCPTCHIPKSLCIKE